jgi:ATP-dependent protease ClpP protease subunit
MEQKLESANGEAAPRQLSKTPLFTANNAARYQRQDLFKSIEQTLGCRKVLSYVCGRNAEIDRDDTPGFVDLLHNIRAGDRIDLVLHTGGGDIDAAEKLIKLVQARVGPEGDIRAVIPDYAKSAGTIMALGARSILMSDSSELGAIDPQFWLKDGLGNDICYSVLQYLAAYQQHERALKEDRDDPVAQLMFNKFDPVLVKKFEGISFRARSLAEDLLKRRSLPYTKIVSDLMDIARWRSHNQMISAADAFEIGLTVEIMPVDNEVWRKYWELHCHQRLAIGEKQKIFESAYVSLII